MKSLLEQVQLLDNCLENFSLIVLLLFSHVQPHGLQHTRLPCSSPSPRDCSNSCPLKSVMPSNHLNLLSSTSPLALNLSQHQGLFQWVGCSHQVAKVLELQCEHQSLQWIFRVDLLVWACSPRDSRVLSGITVQKHQLFGAQPSLWSNSHMRTWLWLLQKV